MSEPQNPATTELTAAPAWLTPFISNTAKMLGVGFTVDFKHGVEIAPTLPDADLMKAAQKIIVSKDRMDSCRVFYDRLLGLMICEYAARHSKSFAEAVDDMGLVDKMGMKFRNFERLPRMVQRNLPESFELVGLTTSHYDAVAAFGGPTEPSEKVLWRARCHEILKEAADDPAERSSRWVKDQMRDLQREFGVTPKKRVPASSVMEQFAALSKILVTWQPLDFATNGVDRKDVLNKWVSVDAELVERDLVPDDSDATALLAFLSGAPPEPAATTVAPETPAAEEESEPLHIVHSDE